MIRLDTRDQQDGRDQDGDASGGERQARTQRRVGPHRAQAPNHPPLESGSRIDVHHPLDGAIDRAVDGGVMSVTLWIIASHTHTPWPPASA